MIQIETYKRPNYLFENIRLMYGQTVANVLEKAEEADLVKGEISDSLIGYGDDKIKLKRSGKDIKERIPTLVAKLNGQKEQLEKQLLGLRETIGSDPTSEFYSNFSKSKFGLVGRYSHDMCRPPYNEQLGQPGEETEQHRNCQHFNDLGYQYASIREDLAVLAVLKEGMKDDEVFSLSVRQLMALYPDSDGND
jgi:hypothetical protein